jgi:mRNA interferase RelE/StbE
MTWNVIYHHEVSNDLEALGRSEARTILGVIEKRIRNGEPDKTGKLLSGDLSGCRRIRTGDTRIVYRVNSKIIEVLIVAVGPRRNDEIYKAAQKRGNLVT